MQLLYSNSGTSLRKSLVAQLLTYNAEGIQDKLGAGNEKVGHCYFCRSPSLRSLALIAP